MSWTIPMVISGVLAIALAVATLGGESKAQTGQAPQRLDPRWTLLVGHDPLEQTAAQDLRDELKTRFELELPEPPVGADALPADGPRVVIGTPETHPLIAAAHRERPFTLTDNPESYHNVLRGDVLFLVGASAKGAMNGVYRFYEGWVYQPNNEIVKELIWNPALFDPANPAPFDPATGDKALRTVALLCWRRSKTARP